MAIIIGTFGLMGLFIYSYWTMAVFYIYPAYIVYDLISTWVTIRSEVKKENKDKELDEFLGIK